MHESHDSKFFEQVPTVSCGFKLFEARQKTRFGNPGDVFGCDSKVFFQIIQVRNSRWPPPRSLQTPVSKSHLHSARVEPPCLESMHFLAAGLSHVCLPKASGQLTCNSPNDTGQSNLDPVVAVPLWTPAVCLVCAVTPQAAGHWPCSDEWWGVGEKLLPGCKAKAKTRFSDVQKLLSAVSATILAAPNQQTSGKTLN